MKQFEIPILFIIFNRPETEKRVFEVIKKIKPRELFVAADGPRKNKLGDIEKCKEARAITEEIEWPCEVKRFYRDKNLGAKIAPYSAIDWFFENVKEGIILEDDCLPDPTFFEYCSVLLNKYRNNTQVMHIGGDNFQNGIQRGTGSYYFSKYPHTWGWATWRRAWGKYSIDISEWGKVKLKKIFNGMGFLEKIYWESQFYCVSKNLLDAWDYQWVYAIWKNSGICITPNKNLVVNIGICENSTHTKRANEEIKRAKLEEIGKIIYPKSLLIETEADKYTLSRVYDVRVKMMWKILLIVPYFYQSYIIKNITQMLKG